MSQRDLSGEKNRILRKAADSREAVGALYRLVKENNSRLSLAWLARRAAIASRGYASDLVSGRRQAPLSARAGLARALGLEGAQKDAFFALVARDHAKDQVSRARYDARLRQARRVLRVHRPQSTMPPVDRFFAFEVFCVFSLFANAPTMPELESYFGAGRRASVETALAQLESWGFIRRVGPRYKLVQTFVLFQAGDPKGPVEFLRASLADALARLEAWFPAHDEAIFQSSLVSVDRARYLALLPKARKTLERLQTGLESSRSADLVVRFNVQIYPNTAAPKTTSKPFSPNLKS